MRNVFDDFLTEQRGRFVLFLPVFMAAGILAYFGRLTEPSLAWSGAFTATTACLAASLWRWPLARAAALCAAFACAGFALGCAATARAAPWVAMPRHATVLTGRVAVLDVLPEGRRVTLAAPSLDGDAPVTRAVRVRLRTSDTADIAPGDTVQIRALLRPPSPPDYPGGWDTQRDAFFGDLAGYGFAIGKVTVIHSAGISRWAALRSRISQRIMADLPGSPGAIASTLLTGIGTAIPQADRAAFQDSGLAHLLAVAGLHIGIVMGLVFAAARLCLAAWEWAALHLPTRQISACAALAAGGFYLALTGAHLPIMRSFAMACLVTLGVLTGRRAVSLRGLALAATVLMVLSPASVVSVSFQMSFSAVLTLIAGYEMARPALARVGEGAWWRRPALYVAGLVLTSALAGTASLPFAAYHFGRATLYYVPANMLAVPLTALWVMPCGLAALALMPLGLERVALVPMGWGVRALSGLAHTVSGWPEASVPVPQMPGFCLALVALGLAWAGLWRGRLRLGGLLPSAAGLLALFLVRPPDILVGPEARLIAVHTLGRTLIDHVPGLTAFEAASPERLWTDAPEPLGSACGDAACRLSIGNRPVLLVREMAAADCTAALLVSSAWLRGACPGRPVFDRATAARDGAATIRMTQAGIDIITDRAMRGNRPWVLLPRPNLPMAQTE